MKYKNAYQGSMFCHFYHEKASEFSNQKSSMDGEDKEIEMELRKIHVTIFVLRLIWVNSCQFMKFKYKDNTQ